MDSCDWITLHALTRGQGPSEPPPVLGVAFEASFGDAPPYSGRFAMQPADDARWWVLALCPRQARLSMHAVADGESLPEGRVPLLALPVHAEQPLAEAWRQVDGQALQQRYQDAVHAASTALGTDAVGVAGRRLIDVRRRAIVQEAGDRIPGARWHDPAQVAAWGGELSPGEPLAVYGAHGHELGRAVALRLAAAGHDVRFLEGGIEAWREQGRPIETLR
ncbi:MAG: rhodanese-like domain-containing protein [Rubrivivax sp.]